MGNDPFFFAGNASGGQGFALHPWADRVSRGQGLNVVFGVAAKTAGGNTVPPARLDAYP